MGQNASSSNFTNEDSKNSNNFLPWNTIDKAILLKVFSHLHLKDLRTVSQVCKYFREVSEDNLIWKPLYENTFNTIYIDASSNKSYKHWYRMEVTGSHENRRGKTYGNRKSCCSGGLNGWRGSNSVRLADGSSLSPLQKLRDGVKLVMLGDSAAGKTSMISRLYRGVFVPFHEATIGASFLVKQMVVDDTPVRFQVWDTAGSERFYSLAPMYYRGAAAAVVVYDVTNMESFDKAKHWVSELQEQASNSNTIIAMAGNKADLTETKGKLVKKEVAEKFAEEKGLIFYETSAKSGQNIIEVFFAIALRLKQRAEEQEEKT